jgi:hypothetical protein
MLARKEPKMIDRATAQQALDALETCTLKQWTSTSGPVNTVSFDAQKVAAAIDAARAALSAQPEGAQPQWEALTAEDKLAAAGVYKGVAGLRGLLDARDFWDKQPYGTRLYFGNGGSDYLHRGVLETAVRLLGYAAPALTDKEIERIAGTDELTGDAILDFARRLIAALSASPQAPAPDAPGDTDAERAAWLADKIVAGGDYAKEAAAMLRRWPALSTVPAAAPPAIDLLALAEKCGATVYRNRASVHTPAVAFGDESWALFCAAVSGVKGEAVPAPQGDAPSLLELVERCETWARQVSGQHDVRIGIRQAGAKLANDLGAAIAAIAKDQP